MYNQMSPAVRFVYRQVLKRGWYLSNQYRMFGMFCFWAHSKDNRYEDRVEVNLEA